jgi:hypothetical protein
MIDNELGSSVRGDNGLDLSLFLVVSCWCTGEDEYEFGVERNDAALLLLLTPPFVGLEGEIFEDDDDDDDDDDEEVEDEDEFKLVLLLLLLIAAAAAAAMNA